MFSVLWFFFHHNSPVWRMHFWRMTIAVWPSIVQSSFQRALFFFSCSSSTHTVQRTWFHWFIFELLLRPHQHIQFPKFFRYRISHEYALDSFIWVNKKHSSINGVEKIMILKAFKKSHTHTQINCWNYEIELKFEKLEKNTSRIWFQLLDCYLHIS